MMLFGKYISFLAIMMVFALIPFREDTPCDSAKEFKEQKQALITTLENRIEELRTNLLELEVKIQKHNQNLNLSKEEIVDQNYVRLQAIKNELSETLKTVKNTMQDDCAQLEDARKKLDYSNDEIKMLKRKIEQKLKKNTRKS